MLTAPGTHTQPFPCKQALSFALNPVLWHLHLNSSFQLSPQTQGCPPGPFPQARAQRTLFDYFPFHRHQTGQLWCGLCRGGGLPGSRSPGCPLGLVRGPRLGSVWAQWTGNTTLTLTGKSSESTCFLEPHLTLSSSREKSLYYFQDRSHSSLCYFAFIWILVRQNLYWPCVGFSFFFPITSYLFF